MPREAVYTLRVDTRQAQADFRRFLTDVQRQTQSATRTMANTAGAGAGGATSSGTIQSPETALASLRAVKAGIVAFAGAQVARQIVTTTVNLTNMATEARRTAAAFDFVSGNADNAAANLAAMERAGQGTISTLEAQRLATAALNLGLATNASELERVMTISRNITAVSPVINDMQSAFSELSLTLANMSWRRLDQLGLSVEEVRTKYDALREADSSLSDQAAFSQAVLDTAEAKFGDLARSADFAASGLDRLRKKWTDLRIEVAKDVEPSGNAVFNAIADEIDRMDQRMADAQAEAENTRLLRRPEQAEFERAQGSYRSISGTLNARRAMLPGTSGDRIARAGLLAEIEILERALGPATDEMIRSGIEAGKTSAKYGEMAEAFGSLTDAINPATQAMQANQRVMGQFRNVDAMRREAADPYFSGSTGPSLEYQQKNYSRMEALADLIRDVDRAVAEGTTGAEEYAAKLRDVAAEVMTTGNFTNDNIAIMSEAVRWWNMGGMVLTDLASAAYLAADAMDDLNTSLPMAGSVLTTMGLDPGRLDVVAGNIAAETANADAEFEAKMAIVRADTAQKQELNRQEGLMIQETKRAWKSAADSTASAWKASLEAALQGIPGLFDTSDVTQEDMAAAAAGTYEPKADEYLRQLRDEVRNGVDYEGVDIMDAAQRAGIDPSLPPEEILRQFEGAWDDSSLFANGQNLDLINQDAVRSALDRADRSASGEAALRKMFGLEPAGGVGAGGTTFTGAGGGDGSDAMGGVSDTMAKAIETGFQNYDFSAATKSMADSLLSAVNQEANAAAFEAVGGRAAGLVFDGFSEGVGDFDWAAAILAAIAEQMSGEYDD